MRIWYRATSQKPCSLCGKDSWRSRSRVSLSDLRQARQDGDRENHAPGPPYVKIGRMNRYRKADLVKWRDQSPRCAWGNLNHDEHKHQSTMRVTYKNGFRGNGDFTIHRET